MTVEGWNAGATTTPTEGPGQAPGSIGPNRKARDLYWFVIPILLLAAVIALFLVTGGAGLRIEPAVPVETLVFERTVLRPGEIEIVVRNTSPQAISLRALNINDGLWPFEVRPAPTIPRLGRATVTARYPWVHGEAYELKLFSSNGLAFPTEIPVAATTPVPGPRQVLSFILVGVYVGVLPVFLGMLWFPALRRLGRGAMVFLLGLTAGLLVFLGIDATHEALEVAARISGGLSGGAFQGVGLVGAGIVITVLLLEALSRRSASLSRDESAERMRLAGLISLGIGIHNFGEGLAIGAAYSTGEATLGTFLVIGFIIQNITEGLGIIVPILKEKPRLASLVWLGVLGGAPAILGCMIGGFAFSPIFAVLFFAVGAGAVFQVTLEVARLTKKDMQRHGRPLTVFSGVTAGMVLMYATGLVVK